ncbi:MAG TPA: NmrA/HSCARG family protein [Dyella sp.]|uniref:NmrA/HSCARG family protein n=1 Tax=Dyella sp. TaxID=1869338 RepID=UPI002CA30649|nr:NmrA/HSCARG family protein [Dyella sp.]HTV83893.1 NmrA/HSCARG family protein [Dyella sp.]
MSILVTGSTGTIGSQVIHQLAGSGAQVRALTRSPANAQLPPGASAVAGDLADIDAFRAALEGTSTLFLLVPNVADELTQAMQALTVAREAGVKGIVYLSVFKGESYADVPHFAGKHTVERMIQALDLPATVLRPAYFIQNDLRQKDLLLNAGVYGMPVGDKGISMVDIRDIGEAAAHELLRRERAAAPLPRESYALVGPDVLPGSAIAQIWSDVLGRQIRYAGNDTAALEKRMKQMMPAWQALDLRLMLDRYQSDGAAASADDLVRLTRLLGHAPRSYRDFANQAVTQWKGD